MNYDTMDAAGQVKHDLLNGLAALRASQPAEPANPVGGTMYATASATASAMVFLTVFLTAFLTASSMASSMGPVTTWLDFASGTSPSTNVASQMSTSFSPAALEPITAGGESTTPPSLAAAATENYTDTSDASARPDEHLMPTNKLSSLTPAASVQHNFVFDSLFPDFGDPILGLDGWETQGTDQRAVINSVHGKSALKPTVTLI